MDSIKVIPGRFSIELIEGVEGRYYLVRIAKDVEYGTDDLMETIRMQKAMGSYLLPALVICPSSSTTNVELMQTLSKNKNNPFSKADAFVIQSISQKILANFYLKIYRPERPTRFFTNEPEAMNWLKQFMK